MLNPCVGIVCVMSSLASFFDTVDLPASSIPSRSTFRDFLPPSPSPSNCSTKCAGIPSCSATERRDCAIFVIGSCAKPVLR